ncbi:hypothetical protein MMC25_004208 [Agyrium rufum]|nr:hypothetical protein [Agyrium rufum]
MAGNTVPSIACIGIIGRQDNPLHIALLPPHSQQPGAYLEFSFLLNSSLDIFDLRARDRNRVDQDLGLLHAVDERLSVWGWQTGTGTRFAIVLDMWGRDGTEGTSLGIRDAELKPLEDGGDHLPCERQMDLPKPSSKPFRLEYVHCVNKGKLPPDMYLPGVFMQTANPENALRHAAFRDLYKLNNEDETDEDYDGNNETER